MHSTTEESERETLHTCPVCQGQGEKRERVDDGTKYRILFVDCFLCRRAGAITAKTLALWIDQGRPMNRDDFHEV